MIAVCRFISAHGQLRLSRSISVATDNDLYQIEHAAFRLARSLFQMDWKFLKITFETFDGSYTLSAERSSIYSGGQGL